MKNFFFQYFVFSSRFMLFFSNIKKKKIGVKKKSGGGGVEFFFLEKQFSLISRFMLFSTLKKILKSAPSLTGSMGGGLSK